MKVGDLVKMRGPSTWHGQTGIVTKVRRSTGAPWVVLLTSGELIETYSRHNMVVISESR